MSKTPYEIRLDILTLARDIMCQVVNGQREELRDRFYSQQADNAGKTEFPSLPAFPNISDIILKADELKKFVDQP